MLSAWHRGGGRREAGGVAAGKRGGGGSNSPSLPESGSAYAGCWPSSGPYLFFKNIYLLFGHTGVAVAEDPLAAAWEI